MMAVPAVPRPQGVRRSACVSAVCLSSRGVVSESYGLRQLFGMLMVCKLSNDVTVAGWARV